MPLSRRALCVLALLTLLPAALYTALSAGRGTEAADAQSVPLLMSPNVELVTTRPGSAAISGVFSRTAPYFYVSGADTITVFDATDPESPQVVGKLTQALFQNEAMTMGERRLPDGSMQRFLLVGNDLAQASVYETGFHVGRPGGRQLIVVDVTDPTSPKIVGSTPTQGDGVVTTSTHTVACMNAPCTIAYSAGDDGEFSIIDLSDLTAPQEITARESPAAKPNPIFTSGSGHHWGVDGAGVALHTGSGGAALFDISDPLRPQALNGTDANGTKTPYNDFIHHNSQRPNAAGFRPGRPASVENGNVALVGEEDYANDGDEIACDRAGSFQTWEVPSLDGGAYRAANAKLDPDKGSMRVLDTINAPAEGGGLSTPAGGFCSAHWFDYHQSGMIAIGQYQQGMRLINVRDARNLKQDGFFTGGATEVWDAYWVPERRADGTVVPGRKTNIIYTVDLARGVDVLRVNDLPPDLKVTGDDGGRGSFPEIDGVGSGSAPGAGKGPAGDRRACGAPVSRFTKRSRMTRKRLRLRGTARGRGCKIRRVRVAIGRKVGSKCRFLKADGRFGKRRSCLRTTYINAKGTRRWKLHRKVRLPRGKYLVWSRAIDSAGQVERKANRRNLMRGRLKGR